MPRSVMPTGDEATPTPAMPDPARTVPHGRRAPRSGETHIPHSPRQVRHRRATLRRGVFGSITVFILVGLAPLAWAAPLDGGGPPGESAVFAPATVAPTKPPPPTAVRPTPTPGPSFVAPGSMARDAGSSMGSDTIRATMPAAMVSNAPPSAAVPPSGLPVVALPTTAAIAAPPMACTPLVPGSPITAAGFNAQWQAGETLTPNFWGPAGTGDLSEPYADAPNGQRLVQYFDKGRMERPDAGSTAVTNGLLATELITGRIQVGDNRFETRAAAVIPLAGDPDNAGPTYAAFGATAASLLAPAPMQVGMGVSVRVAADGTISPTTDGAALTLSSFDATTQHNVPQAFAAYRDRVGLAAIGYAKSEPFLATVKVGGVPKQVMLQIFERRVLTYTADNAPEFQVEMGNIGQHYYQWRYCGG